MKILKKLRLLGGVAVAAGLLASGFYSSSVAAENYGLPMAKPESVGMSSERLQRIAPTMQQFIDTNRAPGLLTVIARHGKVVHMQTFGYADVEKKKPLKPDTIFRFYSMTKPITGTAVMIAYEEGKFLLDDPVAKYLPEFKTMKVYTEDGLVDAEKPITIRHLLTHTSGLSYHFMGDPVSALYEKAGVMDGWSVQRAGMSLEEYVKRIAAQPLYFQPGARWYYSEAMAVLGRLIEVVSGERYGDFVRSHILKPLKMNDTDFYVAPEKYNRLAQLYTLEDPDKGGLTISSEGREYDKPTTAELGGSGLTGTASDYLRFAQMLLNGGELDGVRILSPTSVKLMRSDHLGPTVTMTNGLGAGARPGMGFGLTVTVVNDPVAAGHAGSKGEFSWGGAANTQFWIDPEQDLIGMVFSQAFAGSRANTRGRMHQMTYQAIVGE